MIKNNIERVKRLQEHLLQLGVAGNTISIRAPRVTAISDLDEGDPNLIGVFQKTITLSEIISVCRDLFASGHYSLAVQEAYKAVEKTVKNMAQVSSFAGTNLMDYVFSEKDPKLVWSARANASEVDEHKGYQRLYSGAMLGIRNPVVHEFGWVESAEEALELIIFAQHLLRKTKAAQLASKS